MKKLLNKNCPSKGALTDGYEATRLLREKGETLPIIALTASIPNDIEKDAYAAGITDIVVKPFDPKELYRIILHYVQPVIQ